MCLQLPLHAVGMVISSSKARFPACSGTAGRRGTGRLLEAALGSTAENGGGGGNAAELGSAGVASALPPRYVDFKEAIRGEMVAIRQKMGELRGLHGRAALTTFDEEVWGWHTASGSDPRCLVPLMMLLMMRRPHLHQPWRLDRCTH